MQETGVGQRARLHKSNKNQQNSKFHNKCPIFRADNRRSDRHCGGADAGVSEDNQETNAKIDENASFRLSVALLCTHRD